MTRFPSGILATRCVPWDSEGRFAEPIFRRGVRNALEQGTRHLYIFGTAGEGYAVTERQFDQITSVFVDEMRLGNSEPMVGVISLSLGVLIERIERCRALGVKLFQISLPGWGALEEKELFEFFAAICDRFTDCQFLHYNLPRTKRLVTGKEYGRLAELHPNLVATKNTGDSLSHIESLIQDAPQLQHFLSERGYVYGSQLGECSILASLVTNWSKLFELYEAGKCGDVPAMLAIQQECSLVLQTMFETIPGGRIDGAYDKVFEKMYDPEFSLRLLPPYLGTSEPEFQAFVALLRKRLPHWVPENTFGPG